MWLAGCGSGVVALDPMQGLQSIGGQFLLKGNGLLRDLDAMTSLQSVGDSATLINNGNHNVSGWQGANVCTEEANAWDLLLAAKKVVQQSRVHALLAWVDYACSSQAPFRVYQTCISGTDFLAPIWGACPGPLS